MELLQPRCRWRGQHRTPNVRTVAFRMIELGITVMLCPECDTGAGTEDGVHGPPILLQALREGWA